uniref:Uncharacterized protein n=1 Tax=Arundo donax TaxID=35708 RepID=A0A0A9CPL7_ARUDO
MTFIEPVMSWTRSLSFLARFPFFSLSSAWRFEPEAGLSNSRSIRIIMLIRVNIHWFLSWFAVANEIIILSWWEIKWCLQNIELKMAMGTDPSGFASPDPPPRGRKSLAPRSIPAYGYNFSSYPHLLGIRHSASDPHPTQTR